MRSTWHDVGFDIGLTFFGFALVICGAVIARSRFLPAWLGLLYGLAGVCYLVNSFVSFLVPSLPIFPYILFPCLVDEAKWREVAASTER